MYGTAGRAFKTQIQNIGEVVKKIVVEYKCLSVCHVHLQSFDVQLFDVPVINKMKIRKSYCMFSPLKVMVLQGKPAYIPIKNEVGISTSSYVLISSCLPVSLTEIETETTKLISV